MAQKVAVVNGVNPVTSVGETVDFTESGFGTVSCAIIITCLGNTTNNPQNNAAMSVGFWDGTNQRGVDFNSVDNQATTNTFRSSDDSYAVVLTAGSGLIAAYTASNITDGIRLTLSVDNTSSPRYCTVILFGGVSAKVFTMTPNGTQNATQASPSLGFAPKLAFFLTVGATAADQASVATSIFSYGFTEIGGVNRMAAFGSLAAVADDLSNVLFSETRCVGQVTNNATTWTCEGTSWGSDTLTLTTRDGATGGDLIFGLALGGADLSYDCGTITTKASLGLDTIATDVNPIALLIAMTTAKSTSLQTTNPGATGLGFGASRGPGGDFSHQTSVTDGAATTDTDSFFDNVYSVAATSKDASLYSYGKVDSFNAGNFVIDYDFVVVGEQLKGWFVTFGPPALQIERNAGAKGDISLQRPRPPDTSWFDVGLALRTAVVVTNPFGTFDWMTPTRQASALMPFEINLLQNTLTPGDDFILHPQAVF